MYDDESDCIIRLGISTCLLGEEVRYDGGHKLDRFLVETLGEYVEWVPVCPEVEMGLPVPRESMRLVDDPENPRLVTPKTGEDHTERMQAWARKRLNRQVIEDTIRKTLSISCMFMWVILAALGFGAVFDGIGAARAIESLFITNWDLTPRPPVSNTSGYNSETYFWADDPDYTNYYIRRYCSSE